MLLFKKQQSLFLIVLIVLYPLKVMQLIQMIEYKLVIFNHYFVQHFK
jgi:hypothetical protein